MAALLVLKFWAQSFVLPLQCCGDLDNSPTHLLPQGPWLYNGFNCAPSQGSLGIQEGTPHVMWQICSECWAAVSLHLHNGVDDPMLGFLLL